jgi:hypothetical protein
MALVKRLPWFLVIVVAACGGGGKAKVGEPPAESALAAAPAAPDPAAVSGPGTAGLAACQALMRAADGVSDCGRTAEEKAATKESMVTLRELVVTDAPITDELRPLKVAQCLDFLGILALQLSIHACAYQPPPHEQACGARRSRRGCRRRSRGR